MKNEESNIPQLLNSVEGCFDEIILTDTGSTDCSVEVAKSHGAQVRHFKWCDDFAAARNASFQDIKTDFVAWLDLDDVLDNKQGFLNFRDDAMGLGDYWIANYHYSSDPTSGRPRCTFARERVFRTSKNYQWKYFVHEGVMPTEGTKMQFTPVWAVKHMRTDLDIQKDKLRNLALFENRVLDNRMTYYYGKELFECGKAKEAIEPLGKALTDPNLQMHDRILGMQYLCYCYMQTNQLEQAMQIASQGTILSPQRAEFYTLIGDSLIRQGRHSDAIPAFSAAKSCQLLQGQGHVSAVFNNEETYTTIPRVNLAKIYANLGDMVKAEAEVVDLASKGHAESSLVLSEIRKLKDLGEAYKNATPCDDIVITCPPNAPYLWDGEIAKTKSMGGSETAAIEMASWLHQLTGRPVKIFNVRDTPKTYEGVEYLPCAQVVEYMAKHQPWVHIAWRHNIKLTNAPTFLWCHDLYTPGGEVTANYDQMLCLTPFHKRFVMASQGVSSDKITVTRNGIKPNRFEDADFASATNPYLARKNPNKIVFPSSPDRGLDRAMIVLDEVRKTYPDIELHVFYGIEHLHKWGHAELQQRLKTMMEARPWVKYHGATQQDVLMDHFKEAAIWLHPCDFIESSCITAMEMVCAGVYPVTRRLGGLQDTLAISEHKNMATLLDSDCVTPEEFQLYVNATLKALDEKAWERVSMNAKDLSWSSVAQEWVDQIFPKPEVINGIRSA